MVYNVFRVTTKGIIMKHIIYKLYDPREPGVVKYIGFTCKYGPQKDCGSMCKMQDLENWT